MIKVRFKVGKQEWTEITYYGGLEDCVKRKTGTTMKMEFTQGEINDYFTGRYRMGSYEILDYDVPCPCGKH